METVRLRERRACEQVVSGVKSAAAQANDATRLLYSIGAQISQRLLDTSRKAGRLAFLDVTDRIYRTLFDLSREPEAILAEPGSNLICSRSRTALMP